MHERPEADRFRTRPSWFARQWGLGDIVVTRVARHYSLGRVGADRRTQTPIGVQERRADALNRACSLAGSDHQVFLYENAGTSTCIRINCDQVQTICERA